ncbi:MAG: hypothetical protein CVU42_12585 [Chloroflexi bacterium HGW-Chloroflexi-4]|jgi:hypothetical protein|nr:MAG: hypothetical protein CVU42_12585 [Chloroflexi bacterium HGW-Chloroflexi-4]
MSKYQNPQSWIEALDNYQAGRKHLVENAHKMSQYESETLNSDLLELKESWQPKIEAGAKAEFFDPALSAYRMANGKKSQAVSKELARWDYGAINSHRLMIEARIKVDLSRDNTGQALKNLEALYNEGMAGDLNMQRSTCEVFRGLGQFLPKSIDPVSNERLTANGLAFKADKQLQELRRPPEIIEAEANYNEAKQQVIDAQKSLVRVAELIGQGDITGVFGGTFELGRQIRRVRENPDGSLQILDENEPGLSAEFFRGLQTGGDRGQLDV